MRARSKAQDAARAIAGRSYLISKHYAMWQMRGAAGRRIVVFTMGKTGSTAVARAVSQATGQRAFQVFRLNAAELAGAERRYLASHRDARGSGERATSVPFPGALHLWETEFLLRHLPTPEKPWDVITTVREPVAQAVSAFFHGGRRSGALEQESDVASLTERMLAQHWLRMPMRWFEREFLPALGIDVFTYPFDTSTAFSTIDTPAVRLLLARQENLEDAPEALRDFLRLPARVPIARRNEGDTLEYAAAYRSFLGEVHLPEEVLDHTYASAYARHFYTADELAAFRARWSGK